MLIFVKAVLKWYLQPTLETMGVIAGFVHTLVLVTSFGGQTFSEEGEPGAEGCSLPRLTARIQVAFVCDQTATNINNIQIIARKFPAMMANLNKIHPNTEFALTTHANWGDDALQVKRWKRHQDPEGCYTLDQEFTQDTTKVFTAALAVQEKASTPFVLRGGLFGFTEENSLTGVSMTVADLNIGWVHGNVDRTGRTVRRFVVLFTDEWNMFNLPIPGLRRPFQGDGTDTCTKNLPVRRENAAQILLKNEVGFIGAWVNMKPENHQKYENFLRSNGIPHQVRKFADANDVDENILDYVVNSVREMLEITCEDPPPYNTLGL